MPTDVPVKTQSRPSPIYSEIGAGVCFALIPLVVAVFALFVMMQDEPVSGKSTKRVANAAGAPSCLEGPACP